MNPLANPAFPFLAQAQDTEVPFTGGERRKMTELAASLIFKSIGEDPTREGLLRTPERYTKAIEQILSGYEMSVDETIGKGVFAAEGAGLVTVQEVEFYSLCEHHMLPFWGTASVAYYPSQKIVGLSKIPRLIEIFSRRLQVQERLTHQVAEALKELVDPRAVAVRVKASHLCMMMRGVEKQRSQTVTETVFGLENLAPHEKERIWSAL